ncbi:uncharacterized protein At4g13200, chloroplastic-like [Tasmannia lanceolata]|uniref:uncharacterized protein At4g13200, chloroplastic-like n=1 Tax=Tasmannia lanceolata TaxID=3420 RepID=UPI0040639D86
MGILAYPHSFSPQLEATRCHFSVICPPRFPQSPLSSSIKLKCLRRFSRVRVQSSNGSGFNSGESENKAVLDAFFLGKALAEALSERVESTVGEFLSVFGRWQAEQQKQARDLQEEVFERAKKAKEKAARDAMEEQGIIPKSTVTSGEVGTLVVSLPSPDPNNKDGFMEMMKD